MLISRSSARQGRVESAVISALLLILGCGAAPTAAQGVANEKIESAAIQPLASKSLLLDGAAANGSLVVVGERGHILTSRDGGNSWKQAEVPTRRSLTGVYFHDENLGWAVGHDAAILRSRDGGESWELLNYAPEEQRPFLDVWFADDGQNGFAVGAYGFFYRTTDGGDTWLDTGLELVEEDGGEDDAGYDPYAYDYGADLHLNQVSTASSGRLFIAAEAGSIYRSDDGGATWITLPSPYQGSYFGTLPLEDDSLLLFGLRGHVFRSDDAGESWRELETGTQALLTDGIRLDDGTIVIAGLAGTLLVSRDQGNSFVLLQQADREGLTRVLPRDGGGLVLLGEFGITLLTADELGGGASQ